MHNNSFIATVLGRRYHLTRLKIRETIWLINSVYYYFPGSADEDSGVGGSPGSSSRAAALHNCSMCSKKFSRADILRKHLKTHVNSSCTVCGQIFNDKVALAKHQVEVGQLSTIKFCHPALSSRVNKVATIHDDPHQYFFGINYFKLPLRLEDPLLAFFIILKLSIFWSFSKTLGIKNTYEVIEVDLKRLRH